MCSPLLIAGAALSAGSVAANSAAQSQIASAREDALEAERLRQAQFDRRAQAVNTRSQDRYQDFSGKQGKRAGKLGDYFEGGAKGRATAGDKVNRGGVLPASNSNITVAAEKRSMGDAAQFVGQQADALGDLRAFGDVMGGIGREQAQDASLIDQIGGFKRGSTSILPYELEAANQKGGGLGLLGDLFRGFGGLAIANWNPLSRPDAAGHTLGGGLGVAAAGKGAAASAGASDSLPSTTTTASPEPGAPGAANGGVPSLYMGVPHGGVSTGLVPSLTAPGLYPLYSKPRGVW